MKPFYTKILFVSIVISISISCASNFSKRDVNSEKRDIHKFEKKQTIDHYRHFDRYRYIEFRDERY